MRRLEFLSSLRKSERQLAWMMLGLWLCLSVLMFGALPAALRHVPDAVIHSHAVRLGILYAGGALAVVALSWSLQRLQLELKRKFSIACPSCSTPFDARTLAELGYVERCSSCDARVFEDDLQDSQTNPAEEVSLSDAASGRWPGKLEFLNAIRSYRQSLARRDPYLAAIAFGLCLIALAAVLLFPAGWKDAGRVFLGVFIGSAPVGALGYSSFARRRAASPLSLECPSCRHSFSTRELRDLGYTETCGNCGNRLFDRAMDPPF